MSLWSSFQCAHTARDARQIEQTLDQWLSFCGFAPALELCRRLRRHSWEIDLVATASDVDACRTMWDIAEDGK